MEYDLNGWSYKKYRLEYCENIDGRLGFKCTTTIIDTAYQLEVDHIDENYNSYLLTYTLPYLIRQDT